MSENKVLEALQKATIAAVGASILPAMPIKMVGRTVGQPDDGGPWLEVVYIPNNIENEFWGTEKTYRGILRLLLHWPADDQGAYSPMIAAASIANYFEKGATYPADNIGVKISEVPNLSGVIEAGKELLFPVTVRYSSFNP